MEKIYKILIVFGLLMFVITYSISARGRKFREYFFSKRVPLFPAGDPGTGLLSVMIAGEEGFVQAEDPENQLFFSNAPGEDRQLSVSDRQTGELIMAIPLDESSNAIIFDPVTRLIYSYSSEGALTIIRQASHSSYKVMQRILIPRNGQALAVDTLKGRIYLSAGEEVFVYVNE